MVKHSFHTQAYNGGYIHTWIADGQEMCEAQLALEWKKFPTVIGCKRWINKQQKRKGVNHDD